MRWRRDHPGTQADSADRDLVGLLETMTAAVRCSNPCQLIQRTSSWTVPELLKAALLFDIRRRSWFALKCVSLLRAFFAIPARTWIMGNG